MDFGFEHGSDAPLQGSLSLKRGHRPESGELWAFAMIHDPWFPISRFALLCPQAVVRSCRHGKRNKLGLSWVALLFKIFFFLVIYFE